MPSTIGEPGSRANVLSRGILGDAAGEPVVISPLYKQRIRLRDGCQVENGEPVVRAPAGKKLKTARYGLEMKSW